MVNRSPVLVAARVIDRTSGACVDEGGGGAWGDDGPGDEPVDGLGDGLGADTPADGPNMATVDTAGAGVTLSGVEGVCSGWVGAAQPISQRASTQSAGDAPDLIAMVPPLSSSGQ